MPPRQGLPAAGAKVRARRRELKKSGPEVAKQVGISPTHLRNLENGHNPRATYPVLERLARALDLKVAEIVGTSP